MGCAMKHKDGQPLDVAAQRITTALEWSDLVLDAQTIGQVQEIRSWIVHSAQLLGEWGLGRRLKPGFRSLFHGAPGTGKRLAACLLGKVTGCPVYRIDIWRILCLTPGESVTAIDTLFDTARHENWILFFGEADAVFGKRTEARDSRDRYADQQTAYLLQRLEDHAGVVILTTNKRDAIDEDFARRLQSAILFPLPDAGARLELWRNNFANPAFRLAADVDLHRIAQEHELPGGCIVNVLRFAALAAAERKPATVELRDILDAIRREIDAGRA